MPVPGLPSELPLRAKVRIGEKTDSGRATVLDYFTCPTDSGFAEWAGDKPKTLPVTFPYQTVEQAFPSGLEKWMKGRSGPLLGCYTKGDGTAHRLGNEYLPDGTVKLDPTIKGLPRSPMPCAGSACPYYGKDAGQGCRPQARLNFQIPGGPRDSVYRFETKGLGTIQGITAVLSQYPDLRGYTFELWIETVKQGAKQFPVVSIREIASPPNASSQRPVEERASSEVGGEAGKPLSDEEKRVRAALKETITDLTGWPPSIEQTEWINRVGYAKALKVLEAKLVEKIEGEQRGDS